MSKHETTDVSARGLMWFGIAFVLCGVAAEAALHRTFFFLKHTEAPGPSKAIEASLISQRTPAPKPRLQVHPPSDLAAYRAQQEHLLDSYGWVDRRSGVVRIPINRAMELLLHER